MHAIYAALALMLFWNLSSSDTVHFYNFVKGTSWEYHYSYYPYCYTTMGNMGTIELDRTITLTDTLQINNTMLFYYRIHDTITNIDMSDNSLNRAPTYTDTVYLDTVVGLPLPATPANDTFYSICDTLPSMVDNILCATPSLFTLFGIYPEHNSQLSRTFEFGDSLRLFSYNVDVNVPFLVDSSETRVYLENCGLCYFSYHNRFVSHTFGWIDSMCFRLTAMNGQPASPNLSAQKISGFSGAPAIPLEQIFPNPFNPATRIQYRLCNNQFAVLSISNVSGQVLTSATIQGNGCFTWNATGQPTGLYFCRLKTIGAIYTRKMLLVK